MTKHVMLLLFLGPLFAGAVRAQDGGSGGVKCPDMGTVWTTTIEWAAMDDQGQPVGEQCGDYDIDLPLIGTIGLSGEWCPSTKYRLASHYDCDKLGSLPEHRCVRDEPVYTEYKPCECSKIDLGILTLEGFDCECDGEWLKESVPHYSMQVEPCASL